MTENLENKMNDKLWLVEWSYQKESYRVSRWSDPCRAVAYEEYWEDAVRNIKGDFGIDGLIIFIRKSDGSVDYWCEPDYI